MNRRQWLGAAGAAGLAGLAMGQAAAPGRAVKIVGLACSPRRGKTTATAVAAALDAATRTAPNVETQLIDLGGLRFMGWTGAPPDTTADPDDFDRHVLPHLRDPVPAGLIIGSPVYFRNLSSLCKAMLERLMPLRQPTFALADVPVGVLTVGGFRNGGQELVVQQIQAAMLCHEAMIVGGKPRAHQGATLVNDGGDDDITHDKVGMATAAALGQRVAEAAIRLAV